MPPSVVVKSGMGIVMAKWTGGLFMISTSVFSGLLANAFTAAVTLPQLTLVVVGSAVVMALGTAWFRETMLEVSGNATDAEKRRIRDNVADRLRRLAKEMRDSPANTRNAESWRAEVEEVIRQSLKPGTDIEFLRQPDTARAARALDMLCDRIRFSDIRLLH